MVWSMIAPKDNKPRYIRKYGNLTLLTTSKREAVDSIPEGWEVITLPNGSLKLRKVR